MAPKGTQPQAMSPLGRLLKDAMDERRWSTRDVEAEGGPPASTTGRLINPRIHLKRPPSQDTLHALATVLQIPEQRLRQAVAETIDWDLSDPMQSEPIRTAVAAMHDLHPLQQQTLAKIVVLLAHELRVARHLPATEEQTARDVIDFQRTRAALQVEIDEQPRAARKKTRLTRREQMDSEGDAT